MNKILLGLFPALVSVMVACAPVDETGRTYPGWREGEMDIHHIFTGRGESNFMIFPDGTSMLVDAGDYDPVGYTTMCEELPDSSRRAGEWIARYIARVNPHKDTVDYMMLSHFHNDHTGDCTIPGLQVKDCEIPYTLVGVTQVAEHITFRNFIERGYPTYAHPLPMDTDPDVRNIRRFLDYQKQYHGLYQEEFQVGAVNQIRLTHAPEQYKGQFFITNLSANCDVWNGKEVISYFWKNKKNAEGFQNENTKSISFRINYGPFSYYAGGDLSYTLLDEQGAKVDIEEKVGEACGEVDVCKVNHHGYLDAMSEGFIKNVRARNYVFPVWDYEHIQPSVEKRILSEKLYQGRRNMFMTNLPDKVCAKYHGEDWFEAICPIHGHVVVKVFDQGRQYKIYILTTKDESMQVKAVYGPFQSGKKI